MAFSLCSSAGVQGVFVLLFLAGGGPTGESIEGSASMAGGAALDGPDIEGANVSCAEKRFFARLPAGERVSCLVGASGKGRDAKGESRVFDSISVRSARFDIELQ